MAGLAFKSEVLVVGDGVGIKDLKNSIKADVLQAHGFTNVVNTPSEVAGNRSGCRVSIQHLHIAGTKFWRVVVCMCDGGFDKAKATVDEVIKAINDLVFL